MELNNINIKVNINRNGNKYELSNFVANDETNIADAAESKQNENDSANKLIFAEEMHTINEKCFINQLQQKIDINKLITLTLTKCHLTYLPDCFEELRIIKLDLSHNDLTDVPSCLIKGLRRVQHLNLSYNSLYNFETELMCLNCIETINLEYNKIRTCPTWIFSSKCTNLKSFIFNCNLMRNCLQLAVCNHIESIQFSNCNLMQDHLSSFKTLPNLKCLQLGNLNDIYLIKKFNSFLNCDVLFIKPIWQHTLLILNLQYLNISFLSNDLCNLTNLKELNLMGNRISWLPETITNMKCLEILNISENMITFLPSDLCKLNLKSLLAANNAIDYIPQLNDNLEVLDLYCNHIDTLLESFKKVKLIDLDDNYCSGDEIFDYQRKKCNLRTILNIYGRTDGVKIENCSSSNSSDNSYVPEEDLSEGLCYYYINDEQEVWDVEKVTPNHSDVTPSDDEWIEPRCSRKEPMKIVDVVYDDDYYFCDAD